MKTIDSAKGTGETRPKTDDAAKQRAAREHLDKAIQRYRETLKLSPDNLTAMLGLAFHFLIATTVAAIYYLASRRLSFLTSHAIICGLVYGVGVYLFMNFAVLPLSAFPYRLAYPPLTLVEGLLSHALFVGVPIGLCIRRWARPRLDDVGG